jgi:VCBS repeat-containing protein
MNTNVKPLRGGIRLLLVIGFVAVLSQFLMAGDRVVAEGPCDVPANEIVAENCLAGDPASEWDVSGAGDESIQGFATDISVNKGGSISFKIDTDASQYDIPIYRLGYYGGDGARLVDTIEDVEGTEQVACSLSPIDIAGGSTTNGQLLDCGNWSVSATWQVPTDATSGVYVARPTRTDNGGASHIPFIVRDDTSDSDLLFQTSDTTWQSYNVYGGYNAYGSSGATMAEKLSYNRPFTTRGAELENYLFNAEYPMIRWLERNGYDVSYFSAVDTERHANLITNHDVFLSVGHDEYWSQGRRDAVTAARDAGVHLAFFSGNEVYWKTRWEPSGDVDYRTQVVYKEGSSAPSGSAEHRNCYNNYDCDPSAIWTGQWREAPGSTPENSLSGQISWRLNTQSITVPGEYAPLRFWRDTDVAALGPSGEVTLSDGTLGYEWDPEYPQYDDWYPAGRVLLSTTDVTSFIGPEQHHLSLYRAPSGALVFGAGTVQWSWGLDGNHDRGVSTEDPNMQQATVNLFADMGVQPTTLQANLVAATTSTDTTPPTVAVTSPASGASVPGGSVTITGTASDAGGVVGVVEISTDDGTTWQRATGRESWSHTYTATEGTADVRVRAADDSVNLSDPITHTFEVEPRVCPCSIWPDTATPTTINENDNQPGGIEVGVKFQASEDGYITGLRYYWVSGDTGTHTGNLWAVNGTTGTLLATAVFPTPSVEGWQTVTLGTPVLIAANTTYVASQHSSAGNYSYTSPYFTAAFANTPLTALADGAAGGNGVYKYGASGFPTVTWGASNYWVDVVFATEVGPDMTPPTIVQRVPSLGANNVAATANVTVTFNEPIDEATLAGNFELRDAANAIVAATISYDGPTRTATLDPDANLTSGATYTAIIRGGETGIADGAGNRLVEDSSWSFTVAIPPTPRPDPNVGPGGPILVVKGTGDFGAYLPEIMRAEGLNLFAVGTTSDLNAADLAAYKTVVLGETTLTSGQVTALTDWVTAGGNLVVLRPDQALAGLLGLSPAGETLSEGYIKVDTASSPGAGIVGETMQFHGIADQYTVEADTQVVATLYSNATTATSYPAVTLRSVGEAGGSAAAFTYDLARSVVYTRQGNPDWQGINGDGSDGPVRADDLFHNGTDPDYVDLSKVAIPQADEQQRLLANILTEITADALPLLRFWYLPRGEVAAIVMTADEHNGGNVPNRLNGEIAASPENCSVEDWECIRSTSYLYPSYPLMTAAQASAFETQGFEIALHPDTACLNYTRTQFAGALTSQLLALSAKYPNVEPSATSRNHCISWTDYTTVPEELALQGIHLDTNYYFWPPAWVDDNPGLFTGSGFAQRFATITGELVDVYQATTQMTDESGQSYPFTAITLMDRAISQGYYGTFVINFHTDGNGNTYHDPVVTAAQERSVPIISAEQLLTWTDGRNASSFGDLAWNGNDLTFSIAVGAGANGLQAMAPIQSATGILQALDRAGTPVNYETKTIKGVQYAVFPATAGAYTATYAADTTAPTITGRDPAAGDDDVAVGANVVVTFSEPIDPTTVTNSTVTLRAQAETTDVPAAVSTNGAVVTLDPVGSLAPDTTYVVTVAASVADLAGVPLGAPATWSFTTAAGPACPCNIFGTTPGGSQTVDSFDYELGVKFRSDIDGWITGVRFYKPAGSTGAHIGRLWQANGSPLASAIFVETGSGWQEVYFASPVPIAANTTYVASYSWPGGYYPYQANAFTNAGVTNGPLTALKSGVDGNNGVYNGTPGSFPTEGNGANYFADVIFVTVLETTPPVVNENTPANGATDVPVNSGVTVTFSESMNAATISASTFELRDAANNPVPAAIAYAGSSMTATLTPSSPLNVSATYTATVKGGVDGVKDMAGNALEADVTWTFTTTSDNCPCSIWDNSFTPTSSPVTDGQPIEVGTKFRSNAAGQITALRFYKGAGDTDTHVGNLWSSTGTLLATATSTNETASGWQEIALPTPVSIDANTTYIASIYSSPSGYFSTTAHGLVTAHDNPPLRALASGEEGPNGVYKYGGGFPNGGTDYNYWVDVVFDFAPPDTTPPVISALAATPNADGTATITWTTDEPADSLVQYGTAPDALNLSEVAAALVTSHNLMLTGLTLNTTYYYRVTSADAAGNAAIEPPTGQNPASFTTPAAALIDTTAADFAAGTPGICYISQTGNGELILGPTVGQEFSGTTQPAGWTTSSWQSGGTATFSGNAATVDGARLATDAYYSPGRSMEFIATFGAANFQHVGFGVDVNTSPFWAMFSTHTAQPGLYARTNNNGVATNTLIGNTFVGSSHRYRIDWNATNILFYIDGTLVHTANVSIAQNMRPIISDFSSGGPVVVVDWIRLSPYNSPCAFVSRTFDAGQPVHWQTLTWNGETPAGTSVAFETRTSADGANWSDWAAVDSGGAIASPNGQYIQYRAALSTSNANITPVVADVSLSFGPITNQAPTAEEDSYQATEDTALDITAAQGVLANDSDPDGDPLTTVLLNGPANGALTLNPDGSFTYTPDENFFGGDSFTYKANDGAEDSNVVAVTIAVAAVNDAPLANDDAYSTDEDTLLIVPAPGVLANDTDVDTALLSAVVVTGPGSGDLTLNDNGSFGYTPDVNFVGEDSFTYKVNDGAVDSNTATVTIMVGAANDVPIAANDTYTATEDLPLTIPIPGVLGNDTDADGDTLIAVLDA